MFKNKKTISFNEELFLNIEGNTILVTGGAGFVGVELCKEIEKHLPKELKVLDINENGLEKMQGVKALLGSSSDMDRVNEIFKEYKPDVVFHLATYKNSTLLEASPCEAIKNNVLGTYNVAHAAIQNGSKEFTFISTDKAEEPTDVMSSSMRISEMMILGANKYSKETKCKVIRMDDELNITYKESFDKFNVDDFTFKLQTLVIAARTNDDNKARDYIRQILK